MERRIFGLENEYGVTCTLRGQRRLSPDNEPMDVVEYLGVKIDRVRHRAFTEGRELGLRPKELKSLRSPLERRGAIVSRSVVYEDPHRHTSELARWDQRFPEPVEDAGLAKLLVAAVRAAVVAPERELSRWFP